MRLPHRGRPDGGLYRFVPTTWGRPRCVGHPPGAHRGGTAAWDGPRWLTLTASRSPTRNQVPNTKRFNGGEGAAMSNGRLVFTTKGDNRVWLYDPAANTLRRHLRRRRAGERGPVRRRQRHHVARSGVVYVAEDGGNMQIVLVRETGETFPVVELPGVTGSEITGPAFDPSGTPPVLQLAAQPGRHLRGHGPLGRLHQPAVAPCSDRSGAISPPAERDRSPENELGSAGRDGAGEDGSLAGRRLDERGGLLAGGVRRDGRATAGRASSTTS